MANGTTSTIINTSGERRYFDFLPPAGCYMDADAEMEFFGDVYDWIRQGEKQRQAFDYAVAQNYIAIKNSPATLLYDETLEQTRQLVLDNDALDTVLPVYVTTTTVAPTTTTTTTAAPTTTGA